jgi:WD40 repeat protein
MWSLRGTAEEPVSRVQVVRAGKAATALVEVKAERGKGTASAFCIHPAGWFVTSAHVAVGDLNLILNPSLRDEKSFKARVARRDEKADLALLKVEGAKDLPCLALGSDEGLVELTELVGFGYPLSTVTGREISVVVGKITALRHKEGHLEKIQLDGAFTRGSSGGPVLDGGGKVVGVVNSGIATTGMNFAIPVSAVARFLARPDVQFDPPKLKSGDVHKPVTFEARVAPLMPSPARLSVELVLKAGKGTERKLPMELNGDRYRVAAVPVPPPSGPWTLRLSARFENARLEAPAADRSFTVGGREVKLGVVRSIVLGSPAQVVLRDGVTISGALAGLEAVSTRLSGQTMSVDLSSAKEVSVSTVGESDKVQYTLIVRQGDREIYRQSQELRTEPIVAARMRIPAVNPLSTPVGVAFGPDGNLYVNSHGNKVLRYNGTTGAVKALFVGQGSGGLAGADEMVFGPDGHLYVSSGGTGSVLRYDGSTGAFLGAFVTSGSGGLNAPRGLAFGPDGNLYVAVIDAARILKYDGQTGTSLGTFASGNGLNYCVDLTFGPDGNLYVSDRGQGILEFDGKTGAFIRIFARGGGATGLTWPHGLAFGPDGNLYVAGESSNNVVRFNGQTGDFLDVFVTAGSGGLIGPVGLTFKDGYLFVAGHGNGQVLRYKGTTGAFVDVFTKNSSGVALANSQSLSGAESVKLVEIARFQGHGGKAECAAVSSDGRRVLSGSWDDRSMILWDRETGRIIRRFSQQGGAKFSVAISPDGRRALSGSEDAVLRLWDLESGDVIREFRGHTGWIFSTTFSPDGRLAYSASGGTYNGHGGWQELPDSAIRVWDVETGREVRRLEGHRGLVWSVAVSPDGRRVLSGGDDSTPILWDAETGDEIRRFHTNRVGSVAFLPDGRRAVSGGQETIYLLDLETGQEIHCFRGHTDGINGLAVSPDGHWLLSSSWGGRELLLWDLDARKQIHRLDYANANPTRGCFAPDGLHAAWTGSDGVVRLYELKPDESGTSDSGSRAYLCDMKETESIVGVGVLGKNGDLGYDPGVSVGNPVGGDRRVLVGGIHASKGLSMHSTTPATAPGYSFARYHLDGRYTSFHAVAAANDSVRVALRGMVDTPMIFSVLGDGRELWRSRPLQRPGESEPCNVDVTGVRQLEVRVTHRDGGAAHAVWVDPYVE